MAAPRRGADAAVSRNESHDPAVAEALRTDAPSFSFFQAVRLLGRLRPRRAPVGEWADPSHEVVRFTSSSSLAFPTSEIDALTLADASASTPSQVRVNFFGLVGPQGVLPHSYSEHATARTRAKDTAFQSFLDLFHHRALSLFYRAWEKHRAVIVQERGGDDRVLAHLYDAGGMGTAGLRDRLPLHQEVLAFYAGVLGRHVRPADGLARLVGDYFGVAAAVEQFVGEWRKVDWGGQVALGEDDAAGQLGFGVLGDAAWDPQARVRLRLGPLTRAEFDAFLPGGSAHEPLRALARLYADDQVGVDAQLVLRREEVAPCILDVPTPGDRAPALGRGTWLSSRPLARDPDETSLRLC